MNQVDKQNASHMKHDSASLVTKSKGKRILYFEALRVFACFLVIINHTVNKALPGGEGGRELLNWSHRR